MDNKKVLIAYASAGIGHRKAAEAVYEALRKDGQAPSGKQVRIVDTLDYTNPFFARTYSRSYILLVKYFPRVWAFFYYLLDRSFLKPIIPRLRRAVNAINGRNFESFLLKENPRVVVSSHFLPSEVVAHLKKRGRFDGALITVVTDFGLHNFWINEPTDLYVVASDDTKSDLVSRGVPAGRIRVCGIPVSLKFSRGYERKSLRRILGLDEDKFTVLLIGGGFGVGPLGALAEELSRVKAPIQVIIVCGKNKRAYEQLSGALPRLNLAAKIYGFAENMDELMAVSDIMVTKPGGLTFAEAFTVGLPSVITSPIPGQETKNADFAIKHKAAIELDDVEELSSQIEALAGNPRMLEELRENIARVARPLAAMDVAKLALGEYGKCSTE